MSGLKYTLSDITSFLPNNLFGLKKNYIQACTDRNKIRYEIYYKYEVPMDPRF